jgi:hypothetical protein
MTITTATTLSARAQDVLEKVRALRRHTLLTGFRTTRGQNELFSTLTGDELASVLLVLERQ